MLVGRIFKYPLGFNNDTTCHVRMRKGSEILSCQKQNGVITIWAMVDESQPEETVRFSLIGTGWNGMPTRISENSQFLATIQDGEFVWHIFKRDVLEEADDE